MRFGPCPRARIPRFFQRDDMIDVDIATVTQIFAVIFRIPITRHDITAIRINLGLRNTVALENFFAGVAPVAVKICPVDKQTALVASFIFVLDFDV